MSFSLKITSLDVVTFCEKALAGFYASIVFIENSSIFDLFVNLWLQWLNASHFSII